MKIHQKLGLLISLTLAVASTGIAQTNSMPAPSNTTVTLGSIVATVNDSIITSSELDQQINIATAQLKANHIALPPQANLRQSVLQQMINQQLQLQLAKQANIEISSDQVKHYISALASQQGISSAQWRSQLNQQGLSDAQINKNIQQQLTIMSIQHSALASMMKPSKKDIAELKSQIQQSQQATQNYNIQDINIALPEKPSATQLTQAKATAQKVIAQLKQGKEIQNSARTQVTAMGWRNANQLPALFTDALQGQQAGAVIGPIQAENGLHVLKLINVRTDDNSVSAEQIQQAAMQKKYTEALNKWLTSLREKAYIKISIT